MLRRAAFLTGRALRESRKPIDGRMKCPFEDGSMPQFIIGELAWGMGKILGVYQDRVKREPQSARGQITSNRQSPRDFFNKSPVLS